jgi:predicted signal transduction protein with EAL and GGDEF domain
VLLERVSDAEAAAAVAGRVLDTLRQPLGLTGRTIPIKASLGMAAGRPGVDEAEELLRNADVATLGCQDGQGYLFARPLATSAMTELLATSLADGGFHLPTAQPAESLSG